MFLCQSFKVQTIKFSRGKFARNLGNGVDVENKGVVVTYMINSILAYWEKKSWVHSREGRPISKFSIVFDSIITVLFSFFFLDVFDSISKFFITMC